MKNPAAKKGDLIVATDKHLANGSVVKLPFSGKLDTKLSGDTKIENRWAAMQLSKATNNPPHVPPPGKTFDNKPTNKGVIVGGSGTVLINNRNAARNDDLAATCNDVADPPQGHVVAKSTVIIGD